MSILSYQFKQNDPLWHLEPVRFSDFNLLVGVSGVGKTRTLNRLEAVCAAGRGHGRGFHDSEWEIEVDTQHGPITWSGVTEKLSSSMQLGSDRSDGGSQSPGRRRPTFLHEVVRNERQQELVVRDEDGIRLLGSEKPIRMKGEESVVSLLQNEETIAPLYRALGQVHRSRSALWSVVAFDVDRINELQRESKTFEALQNATVPMAAKAYVLQEKFPERFSSLVETYREIFPRVEKIVIGPTSELREADAPRSREELVEIVIEEHGVEGPIFWNGISAGMRRTLRHILDLTLVPQGTVILVDEYENSMGINCLEAVTDLLLKPERDLQLIITSHHPYVINNVPVEHWLMVNREGSTVRITPASQLPAFDTKSKQDAFTRLVSATDYLDGVQ